MHHLVAFVGDLYRTFSYRRGFGRVGRHLVDGLRHLVDRRGRFGNLLGLMLRRLGQVHGGGLGVLHRTGDLPGSEVDGGDQVAQLVHGIVDGVCDGAGKVFGDRGGDGKVAVGQVFDFIQQAHDRVLVALVLLRGFMQLAVGLAHHDQADQDDRGQRQQAQHVTADGVEAAPAGEVFKTRGQVRGFIEQGLRQVENIARRGAHLEQLRRGLENFIHGAGDKFEQLGDVRQPRPGVRVFDLGDTQPRVAVEHAIEHHAKTVGIAAEGIGGLHGGFIPRQHRVDRPQDTFGQQRLALGQGNLAGRGAALQQDIHDLFRLDLQLRHGFGQGRRHLVQRQHGLLAGQDGVGVFQQRLPVGLHRPHFGAHRTGRRRQAGLRVTFFQVAPALGKIVARIAQQLERRRFPGSGLGGVLGNALGQHAQLTGVADVLFVVGGLGVEVREVGEQQHDEHDQGDKQHDDLRTAARSGLGFGRGSGAHAATSMKPGAWARAKGLKTCHGGSPSNWP